MDVHGVMGVYAGIWGYMRVHGGIWGYMGDGDASVAAGELMPIELYHPERYYYFTVIVLWDPYYRVTRRALPL